MRCFAFRPVVAAALLLAATISNASAQSTLANPASQNCVAKGGTITIETNPKSAEYGVCVFADNLQCEEWAMLQCRTGGVKVTGYATHAARYCAITGGAYGVTSSTNTPDERGTCTFANGKRCDASAYYAGSCTREAAVAPPPKSIRARFQCNEAKSIDATFVNGAKSRVKLVLSDGRTLTLLQVRSGSGARYANASESIVFWNKGNTAFIEETGKMTYDSCVDKG